MTNKEVMVNLSDEAFFDKLHWLTHVYGKGFTDSRIAIIKWLGKEAEEPDRVYVVRCRDCKHSKRMCQPWNDLICDKHGGANMPDWFCADGEREE